MVTDYPEDDVLQRVLLEFYQTGFEFYLHPCICDLTMQQITLACCVLNNILRTLSNNSCSPSGFADEVEENGNIRREEWRDRNDSAMQPLAATAARHPSHNAEKIEAKSLGNGNA